MSLKNDKILTMTNSLTIIVFTYNNEKEIANLIDNGKILTENLLIFDLQSSDQTIKIAKEKKVNYYVFPHVEYVELARQEAIKITKSPWVFILDSDERLTSKLAKEIKEATQLNNFTHYKIPRKNIFINHWLKHGGWWPDYQIRLINKKYFVEWPKKIHSTPMIKGSCGYLKNPLLHFFHGDLHQMVEKTTKFEDIESDLLYQANRSVNTLTFFRKFAGELWRRMFKNLGFLDGVWGIIESIYQAFSKTITYLFLYEKKHRQSKEGRSL